MNKHLATEESFTKYLGTLACVNCIFLGITDLPVDTWKCKHEKASVSYPPDYPNGVEVDKDWMRNDDIEREKRGDRSLPLPRRDVNFYFMCPFFQR
jgi:hypothetical protein